MSEKESWLKKHISELTDKELCILYNEICVSGSDAADGANLRSLIKSAVVERPNLMYSNVKDVVIKEVFIEIGKRFSDTCSAKAEPDYDTLLVDGCRVIFVDPQNNDLVESGIVQNVSRIDGKIFSFSVVFEDDFDEFGADALGKCVFLDYNIPLA